VPGDTRGRGGASSSVTRTWAPRSRRAACRGFVAHPRTRSVARSLGLRNKKTPRSVSWSGADDKPGGVLLSHRVAPAVPSAQEGLTTVFGMGTGVAPPVWPPEKFSKRDSRFVDSSYVVWVMFASQPPPCGPRAPPPRGELASQVQKKGGQASRPISTG
jgi:hypothetical protein